MLLIRNLDVRTQVFPQFAGDLVAREKRSGLAVCVQYRATQCDWRVWNVCSTDVEQPGRRVRVRKHDGVSADFRKLLPHPAPLAPGRFARKLDAMRIRCGHPAIRPVRPAFVDGVFVERDEIDMMDRLDVGNLVLRVQLAPVPELRDATRVVTQPLPWRQCTQVLVVEQVGRRFEPCLFRVPAVDEQYGRVRHDNQRACRSRETGGP